MSDWFAARSDRAGRPRRPRPGDARPGRAVGRRAGRGGPRRPRRRGGDRREGRAALLRLAGRVGALEGDGARRGCPPGARPDVAAELRATAAAGFVLARNAGSLLPLDAGALRRVAVLGPNAAVARTLGGGSATVFPRATVSPLTGLRAALGDGSRSTHSRACAPTRASRSSRRALLGDDGAEVALPGRRRHAAGRRAALRRRVRLAGRVPRRRPGRARGRDRGARRGSGRRRRASTSIGCSGARALRARARTARSPSTSSSRSRRAPTSPRRTCARRSTASRRDARRRRGGRRDAAPRRRAPPTARLGIPARSSSSTSNRRSGRTTRSSSARSALAAAADVAVVVVGTTEEVESEGFDRDSLDLPGRQDELVAPRARRPTRARSWWSTRARRCCCRGRDEVAGGAAGVVPGPGVRRRARRRPARRRRARRAAADDLAGRRPTACPPPGPTTASLDYDEGLFVGYRGYDRDGRAPRVPLRSRPRLHRAGSTLGLEVAGERGAGSRVRNTGARPGREVVQLYASRADSAVERPPRWLVGFATVDAAAGEEMTVEIAVPERTLAHWDAAARAFVVEPGDYELAAGRSSRDLRCSGRAHGAGLAAACGALGLGRGGRDCA